MPAVRLVRWVENFSARHGDVTAELRLSQVAGVLNEAEVPVLQLSAFSAVAELTLPRAAGPAVACGSPVPARPLPDAEPRTPLLPDLAAVTACLSDVSAHLLRPGRLTGVVLVRRGGYAVGVVDAGELGASKVGTRYVQSRTAAGGWSQQRYARRRDNQAQQLVDALLKACGHVLPPIAALDAVIAGGDRQLVTQVLNSLALPPQLVEPRLLDVPDPRRDVLQAATVRATSSVVRVTETA